MTTAHKGLGGRGLEAVELCGAINSATKGAAAMVKGAHRDCVGHATLTYRKTVWQETC
jgi:hypothetical protein